MLSIAQTPSTDQVNEALPILQGIMRRAVIQTPQSMITIGTRPKTSKRKRQRDFTSYVNDIALPQNVYVHCNLTQATEVLMPFDAGDGARMIFVDVAGNFATQPLTLNGNGNLVDGAASKLLDTNGMQADFFYRKDLAEWRSVSPLLTSSTVPFPDEYDDMFVLLLAVRLLVRYGRSIDEGSAALLDEMRERFKARYMRTTSDVEADVLFESEYKAFDSTGGVNTTSYDYT